MFQALWLALLLHCLANGSTSNRAVVVGVNEYAHEPAARLNGCVGDARNFAATLCERPGWQDAEIVVLTDEAATRAGILAAIEEAAERVSETGSFVFFFAGHGSRGPTSTYLLPHDFKRNQAGSAIDTQLLYDVVRSVPGRAASVVLDSCFSGAMMRVSSLMRRGGVPSDRLRPRYYPLFSQESMDGVRGAPDVVARTDESGRVCYFTAAGPDQFAWEGSDGGLFTNAVVRCLTGAGPDLSWGELHQGATVEVEAALERTPQAVQMGAVQRPRLTSGFAPLRALDNEAVREGLGAKELEELLALGSRDPDVLAMSMDAVGVLDEGEAVEVVVRVATGHSGYLLILNRDPEGNVKLLYPLSAAVEQAHVAGGIEERIPPDGKRLVARKRGTEFLKAYLFQDARHAQQVMAMVAAGSSGARLELEPVSAERFVTSELAFVVLPDEE